MMRQILRKNKEWLEPLLTKMFTISLNYAAREQGLENLAGKLGQIVPDLTDQHTNGQFNTKYRRTKVRNQHAFQIKLVLKAIDFIYSSLPPDSFTLIDIGDSSGNHLLYIQEIILNKENFISKKPNLIGLNIDPVAVEKIKKKGFQALLCRAEDFYQKYNKKADLLISFEMIEHLYDPISFLDSISKNNVGDYFALTVPYLAQSRVGLKHIRQQKKVKVTPENTHIFEFSPSDWKLIFQHAGWKVMDEMIYRQYPSKSPLLIMKPLWKQLDFEGFYGVILTRDRSWSECYK